MAEPITPTSNTVPGIQTSQLQDFVKTLQAIPGVNSPALGDYMKASQAAGQATTTLPQFQRQNYSNLVSMAGLPQATDFAKKQACVPNWE